MGEVLGDLAEGGEHAHAPVLELRGAVPLHLLGGAVPAEPERVEGAAGLDVEANESLDGVAGDGARGGGALRALRALLRRHLEAGVVGRHD